MSSTTPSATRKSASLARLQVENGRPCSAGLDLAIFLTSRCSGRVNVAGRPPGHHRPGAPADDPQQAPPLVVIDLADAYSFCHPDSLATPRRPDQYPNGASRHYRAKVP